MSDRLKSLALGSVGAARAARLRWKKSREARRALSVLTGAGRGLSDKTKRRAREEAAGRFGDTRHADWLMVYAAVQGEFREGWIPDSYYLETIMPRVNGISHHLSRTRAATPSFFNDPAICDLCYALNTRFLGPDLSPLQAAEVLEILKAAGPQIVFKADHSGFGKGVRILNSADLTAGALQALGNGIFQPRLSPHPMLNEFGSDALPTLRIGTVITPAGVPEIRCCYLKIGRPGQSVILASNQVRVAIDWKTGEAAPVGYLADWTPVTAPPGNTLVFSGVVVPFVKDAAETAVTLHGQMPLPGYVCWDFAIDQFGAVRLLEWEGGVVSFAEAAQGPCFMGLEW